MRLGELFPPLGAGVKAIDGNADVEIDALALDHRRVVPGTAFFCVRGLQHDGHRFAADAAAAGAAALIVESRLKIDLPQVLVADVRSMIAPAAARLAGDPTATLALIGITGTSGKTTTATLLAAVLAGDGGVDAPGCGLVGTVASRIGGVEQAAVRTTPEALDLQPAFRAMLDAGDRACAIEVSSHALVLGRVDAIHWRVAAFTNLGHDHLDFHADLEDYYRAKRRLFEVAAAAGATLIAVSDDRFGRRLVAEIDGVIGVAIDNDAADLKATALTPRPDGTSFTLDGTRFDLPLPGRFNVLNALIVIAAARQFGLSDRSIAARLADSAAVPGRFEPVHAGQDFSLIVDYAHKPEAVEQVLIAARELASGRRVCCVIGAGGDRDREKRPLIGRAAAEGADHVILTTDNPRSERPEAIIAELAYGAPGAQRIVDRRAAIAAAVAWAQPGDVVLLAGKGHERYQELSGGRSVPFDDREVARAVIDARLGR